MKKFLLSAMAGAMVMSASAQMPSHSIAPNFTGVDLNGTSHTLYDYLDQGYTVIIDVSATWCGPCWSYHQAHHLKNLYTTYGPGTSYDRVMVLFIEGDAATGVAQLNGTPPNTQGNWVTGTPYPIIDNATIANQLQIGYFPTIYKVCPNRVITEVGQKTTAQLWTECQQCSVADTPNDAMLIPNITNPATCAGSPVDLKVRMSNVGTAPITSRTVQAKQGSTVLASTNWTGSLGTYQNVEVNVGSFSPTSNANITYEITNTDDDMANNNAAASVAAGTEVAPGINVSLELKTDNYGSETTWKLFNPAGTVIAQDPAGNYSNNTVYNHNFPALTDLNCYRFEIYDAYGDGMCCAYGNGYYKLKVGSNVFLEGGEFDNVEVRPFKTNILAGIEDNVLETSLDIFPNPTNGLVTVQYQLPAGTRTRVEVYNLLGEQVLEREQSVGSGMQQQTIDLGNLTNGIYSFRIIAGDHSATRKVTVTK
ncbi:MAG: T9SS type A sorting domain-containing protein [Flavobacteriales bacterium]|nr:T9SS type A sorting domain-containing protein [Flavobacteriales bacterium]